jgi:hypothetical protein
MWPLYLSFTGAVFVAVGAIITGIRSKKSLANTLVAATKSYELGLGTNQIAVRTRQIVTDLQTQNDSLLQQVEQGGSPLPIRTLL